MGKRIVVKVGSNVLTREDGKLDVTRMSAIVDQIVWLRKHDYEVILVSSGAVAAGRAELHVDHHLDSVEQRQLFSAIGQVKLVGLYYNLFREYKIKIGQVLTMKENFGAEEQYQEPGSLHAGDAGKQRAPYRQRERYRMHYRADVYG